MIAFDFKALNAVHNSLPDPLKLAVATNLLEQYSAMLYKYKSPRLGDVEAVVQELKQLKASIKADSAARAKARAE